MKRNITVMILAAFLLILTLGSAQADWSGGGNMTAPAELVLIPQNAMVNRFHTEYSRYTWSYAPLYSKPEERRESALEGPAPTDTEVYSGIPHLKLPGSSFFVLDWICGWSPDRVTVSSWSADVFEHPEQADSYYLGSAETVYGRVALEPGRVYQFHASWGSDPTDERLGEADYYLVTEQFTEDEAAETAARIGAPYSEEDLRYLTMTINGVDCVLGQTTPRDLKKQGLHVGFDEPESTYYIVGDEGFGFVYMWTENGLMDDPVTSLNAYWVYDDLSVIYGGYWEYPDLMEETASRGGDDGNEDDGDWDSDDGSDDDWGDGDWDKDGGGGWWADRLYVDESVEGIYTTVITLSNGREVEVSIHDTPPSLALLKEKAFRPLEFRSFDVDLEGGSYNLRITDEDRVDTEQYFMAELYQQDLYPREGLAALQAGDRIQLNGRVVTITELNHKTENDGETGEDETEEDESGENSVTWYEIGYEIPEEDFTDFYMLWPAYGQEDLYYAQSLEDWVASAYLTSVKISLPLPENFSYVTASAGEETEHTPEEFLECLRNGEARNWSRYNTCITFEKGEPVEILHSEYPGGPDEE